MLPLPSNQAKKVILLGLGTQGNKEIAPTLGSLLAKLVDSEVALTSCTIVLPSTLSLSPQDLSNLTCDYYTSLYRDNRYRTGTNVKIAAEALTSLTLVLESTPSSSLSQEAAAQVIQQGQAMAEGVLLAKDIVNAPHNVLNSESMANVARELAEKSGGTLTCTILGKEECEARGMGSYLGVARGSETDPQFIHVTYTPKSGDVRCVKVGIWFHFCCCCCIFFGGLMVSFFWKIVHIAKRWALLERVFYLIRVDMTSKRP